MKHKAKKPKNHKWFSKVNVAQVKTSYNEVKNSIVLTLTDIPMDIVNLITCYFGKNTFEMMILSGHGQNATQRCGTHAFITGRGSNKKRVNLCCFDIELNLPYDLPNIMHPRQKFWMRVCGLTSPILFVIPLCTRHSNYCSDLHIWCSPDSQDHHDLGQMSILPSQIGSILFYKLGKAQVLGYVFGRINVSNLEILSMYFPVI